MTQSEIAAALGAVSIDRPCVLCVCVCVCVCSITDSYYSSKRTLSNSKGVSYSVDN